MSKKVIKKVILLTVLCVILSAISAMGTSCIDTSNKNPVVTMNLDPDTDSGVTGSFHIELFADKAPNSVNFFIELINEGFYTECVTNKVVAGHLVEISEPWYLKKGDKVIEGEFEDNGYTGNDVEFVRGTVGFILYPDEKGNIDNNSAVGSFFVVLSDEAGKTYTGNRVAIGKIVSGIEILDQISQIKNYPNYQPITSAKIKDASVDLKGSTYPAAITSKREIY